MQKTLELQYDLIKSARGVLLDYCDTIRLEDFLSENSTFGTGSIRNLLVHNANTYLGWLGIRALKREQEFIQYDSIQSVTEVRRLFEDINLIVADFIAAFSADYTSELHLEVRGTKLSTSPFKLFTHVITHEFHHKGQVLSLSRHLGYTPVDTDVMR